jgi:GT2 family glycosyltransferase
LPSPSHPSETLVTVVVVAREGFRRAPSCLRHLLRVTLTPYRLVYVDGGSPRTVSRRLARLVRTHGGVLIRSKRYLRPTRARNLGFQEVGTRYAVFIDNDVTTSPGWLEALVRCAEQTGAAYVSPIICIGSESPPVVHVAGGENRIVREGERRRLIERYAHAHQRLPEVLAEVDRQETTMAEFHAVLVRTDVLRRLGGLDESCPTAFEHNDLCLSVAAAAETGWLEPGSIVHYVPGAAADPTNFAYHLLRWSRAWIDESLEGFCAKWQLGSDDPALVRDLASLHSRRKRPTLHLRKLAKALGGYRAVSGVDFLFDWLVERTLRPRHDQKAPAIRVYRWS